jgi:hypothetical protein
VGPLQAVRAFVKLQTRWRLYRSEWFVAYRASGDELLLLDAPAGEFYADPFPFERDGRRFVFFEHLLPSQGHGVISFVEVGGDGSPSTPEVALSRPYHLSYPFLFVDGDDVYMLPSTRVGVELYRADPFPDRWTLVRMVMSDVVANDPTLLAHDGRLWLFANVVREHAEPNEELHLFWADSLEGPWTPHAANPVVSDVRSARPAGRIFRRDGMLIRPGQDCAGVYGRAVVLNRIETLTTAEYHESTVGRLEPTWLAGNIGTHTYNAAAGIEAIDGYRLRLRRPIDRRPSSVERVRLEKNLLPALSADATVEHSR